MENKKEIKKIKEMVKTICQSCKNYEDAEKAMSLYFTEITDSESPRKEEFNEKYNIIFSYICHYLSHIFYLYNKSQIKIIRTSFYWTYSSW